MAMELGGNAWEKAGQIWYVTMTEKLFATANFDDAARLTYKVAGDLYGTGSREQKAVRFGWREVGLSVGEVDSGNGGDNEDPDDTSGGKRKRGCFDSLAKNNFIRQLFGRS
jgi:hypothetical protein